MFFLIYLFNLCMKPFIFLLILLFLFLPILSLPLPLEASSFFIPLEIKNNLSVARVLEPITSGIPLPKEANIFSSESLSILDASKNPIPAQFLVTARWGGSPEDITKPIKWVLASFFASVESQSIATYYLSNEIVRAQDSPITIVENSKEIIINTGPAQFTIDKQSLSLWKQVVVDGTLITQANETTSELLMLDGSKLASNVQTPSNWSLVESGSVRTILKREGPFQDQDGTILLDQTFFLTFYANQKFVEVSYKIGNHAKAMPKIICCGYDVYNYDGQNAVKFSGLNLSFPITNPQPPFTFLLPDQTGVLSGTSNDLFIYQDSSGTNFWDRYQSTEDAPRPNSYSQFQGYQIKSAGELLKIGNHFDGWIDVSDQEKGITVAIKDFWQTFPKAFSFDQEGVARAELFPEAYLGDHSLRVGEEKTTTLGILFHTGQGTTENSQRFASRFKDPLFALAPSDWYLTSGALSFMTSSESVTERYGQWNSSDPLMRYDYYNDRTLIEDPLFTGSHYYPFHSFWQSSDQSPSSQDYFNMYGSMFYGNQALDFEMKSDGKAGFFNSKYDLDWGAWIQFLRTRDTRWKDIAQAFSDHREQLMLHNVETSTGYDINRWKNAIFGHSYHNESGNQNGVRNYGGPVMNTAWGVRGAALSYYLTGNESSKRFFDGAIEYAYQFYQDHYESDYLSNDSERYAANLLSILVEAFELTGNVKYQQLASQFIDYYAPQNQPYIKNQSREKASYIKPWMLGMYLEALGRYRNVVKDFGMTKEQQIAENHFLIYTDWLLNNAVFTSDGWLTTNYQFDLNQANRNNPSSGNVMINNWMLVFADVCAYAYSFTQDENYLSCGSEFFKTAVFNPFFKGSELKYSSVKEVVNHAVFGHVYLFESAKHSGDYSSVSDSSSDSFVSSPPSSSFPLENENLLKNARAEEGLNAWNTAYASASISNEWDENAFALSSGHMYQEIDLEKISLLDLQKENFTVWVTASMRSQIENADSGFPYIYVYLIGTDNDPELVSNTLKIDPVSSWQWQTQTKTIPLTPGTKKIRIFLKKSYQKETNLTNSTALFDDLSVRIQ